ncbi:MAG: ATP-binding protein [Actinomycetia bacterium]|nr:ATP-binding protein [Actinomycetes bacterium]
MSDGEKAALYLAGRALTVDEDAVLIIDEPETHLQSLLAVQLWDAIEEARPGLRLIYATHDMTFAASQESAHYLLANPEHGLKEIQLAEDVGELAAIMLGAATLSFHANKVIFREGEGMVWITSSIPRGATPTTRSRKRSVDPTS